jgi:hypothetical protein
VERTFSLVTSKLGNDEPGGTPDALLQRLLDAVLEAFLLAASTAASRSLAVDWTDVESFSTRRTKDSGAYADTEAAWGHRKGGGPGERDELFFGYYRSLRPSSVTTGARGPRAGAAHEPRPLQPRPGPLVDATGRAGASWSTSTPTWSRVLDRQAE